MRALSFVLGAVTAIAASSSAYAATGDILIKLKGGYDLRSGSSAATVTVGNTAVKATPKNGVAVEGSVTLFVSEHIAVEGGLRGSSYDLDDASGRTLASSSLIQPTVMLEYHLSPAGRMLRPYVGIGATYIHFYDEKPGEILTNQSVQVPVSYAAALKSSIAPTARLGTDVSVSKQLYLTVEGSYTAGKSKLTITQGYSVKTVSHDVRLIGVSAGIGFRF